MRVAALLLILLALLCAAYVSWQTQSTEIKAVLGANEGVSGNKSIMEDMAYWFWPAKWDEYQDARHEAALERIRNMTPEQIKQQANLLEQLSQSNKEPK